MTGFIVFCVCGVILFWLFLHYEAAMEARLVEHKFVERPSNPPKVDNLVAAARQAQALTEDETDATETCARINEILSKALKDWPV